MFHHCLSCSISSRTSNCRIENCRVIDSSSSSSNSSSSNNCNSGSCLPVIISVRGLPCLLSSSQLLTLSFTGCLLPCLLKHVGYWWHRKSMSRNWVWEFIVLFLFLFILLSFFLFILYAVQNHKTCQKLLSTLLSLFSFYSNCPATVWITTTMMMMMISAMTPYNQQDRTKSREWDYKLWIKTISTKRISMIIF